MRFFLPYHLGSGNRGCEGIARGIANIFNLRSDQLVLFDITEYDLISDKKNGLDEIAELRFKGTKLYELIRLGLRLIDKIGFSMPYNYLKCYFYLKDMRKDDVLFMTGGDIYCYENQYVLPNLLAQKVKEKGIKSVLFGASIEEKFLTPNVIKGLKNFDLIITRDMMSSITLNKYSIQNYIFPDPAFSLEPKECELPNYFLDSEVVGINFSPFIDENNFFKENMTYLIDYITSKGMKVCFIPHVFWKDQDDRTSIEKYGKLFNHNVYILDSEKLSYLQIRYIISKCKFFIGGRTHSVISAYSTHVPCIALGYSVKSLGISREIGMPDYTVIDSRNLQCEDVLLRAFCKLEQDQEQILSIYKNVDEYRKKAYEVAEIIRKIFSM